jgi:hypothetical protein
MESVARKSTLALALVAAVAIPAGLAGESKHEIERPISIERSIAIKATPQQIASILEDPALTAKWNPLLSDVKPDTFEGRGINSTLDWTAKVLGVTLVGTSVATEWNSGQSYAWNNTEHASGQSLEGRFALKPRGNETILTATLSFTVPEMLQPVVRTNGVQGVLVDAVGRALNNIDTIVRVGCTCPVLQ